MQTKEHNIEDIPNISTADRVTIDIEKGNTTHIVEMISTAIIKHDELKLKEPNPDLNLILNLNYMKLYFNTNELTFWLMIQNGKLKPIWRKIHEHDINSLKCLAIAIEHKEIPKSIWLRKTEIEKVKQINERINNKMQMWKSSI